MSKDIQRLHGVHAANTKLSDFRWDVDKPLPNGEAEFWDVVCCQTKASALKLIFPDHGRREAQVAKAHGLRVLVRAPGEGIVHSNDVMRMIHEFVGCCDWIEVGNEPNTSNLDEMWTHAWYLENVWNQCSTVAQGAGITLVTPGWRGGQRFGDGLPIELVNRLKSVYGKYPAHGIHNYDPFRLATPLELGRIQDWFAAFPNKRYLITEFGIAAKFLANETDKAKSDMIKAGRYYDFLASLALNAPYVEAAFFFILSGTKEWSSFDHTGAYNPLAENSYWLSKAALAELGRRVHF